MIEFGFCFFEELESTVAVDAEAFNRLIQINFASAKGSLEDESSGNPTVLMQRLSADAKDCSGLRRGKECADRHGLKTCVENPRLLILDFSQGFRRQQDLATFTALHDFYIVNVESSDEFIIHSVLGILLFLVIVITFVAVHG